MVQTTQGRVETRKEQLGQSDHGVILQRKIILNAIKTALEGGCPKGVLAEDEADKVIKIDSFTGVRPRGMV